MKEVVFLNGKFVGKEKAKVSALEPGFLYGWGVFETMRAYRGRILGLEQHLKRFKEGARAISVIVPYPVKRIKSIIRACVKKSGYQDAYIKLLISRAGEKADMLVLVKKYTPYPLKKYTNGFSANVSRFRVNESSPLTKVKSTNYLLYALSWEEAKQKGFDEALLFNTKGFAAEGSRTNLFLVKKNSIDTPSLASGCVDGVTRRIVSALAAGSGFKVQEKKLCLKDIYESDEAFLTNSLIGIMPLTKIEGHRINRGKAGVKTAFLMKRYQAMLVEQ
jgi:branched-chain amino acid aminotransferase